MTPRPLADLVRPVCLLSIAVVLAMAVPERVLAEKSPVTTCGQAVVKTGYLTGDLDCTGVSGPGIHLVGPRTRLELNGFTLSGGGGDGVLCDGGCRITSSEPGGSIEGFAGDGVVARHPAGEFVRINVKGPIIRDNGGYGVRVDQALGGVAVRHAEVSGNGMAGVLSPDRLLVYKSVVSGNALEGANGARAKIKFSTIDGNAVGVYASELRMDTCEVTNNVGDGIHISDAMTIKRMNVLNNGGSGVVIDKVENTVRLLFVEVSDNALDGVQVLGEEPTILKLKWAFIRRNGRYGVNSRNFRLAVSRVDENGVFGVYAGPGVGDCQVRIRKFSVRNNGTLPSCGVSQPCADIASCSAPLAVEGETECATSYDTTSGFPGTNWGVCSED